MDEKRQQSEGDRVRQLRLCLGLKRAEFGMRIGYSNQHIIRIEEGQAPVSDEMRKRISREYHVSEEWLRDGSDKDGQVDIQLSGGSEQRRQRLNRAYWDSRLTQREFARITHTSTTMLNEVLQGKRQMTTRYAKKIEDALGIGADWILYGDEDAKNYPCDDAMVDYLKKHPDARKELWEKMKEEAGAKEIKSS